MSVCVCVFRDKDKRPRQTWTAPVEDDIEDTTVLHTVCVYVLYQ